MNIPNFLYCFDTNYNIQGLISMTSLLNNLDSKINIFIIHNDPDSIKKNIESIKSNKHLNNIEIFQYSNPGIELPNLSNSHVSEATYYRLFIQNYLPAELKELVYVDADIICFSNPIEQITFAFEDMKKENKPIAALTEYQKENETSTHFERLKLSGNKYFNAGVMLIDYQQWREDNLQKSFIELLKKHHEKIKFWDQDILNAYFDSNFYELNEFLNYKVNLNNKNYSETFLQNELEKIIFLHYAGSFKPWTVRGAYHKKSQYYHDYFLKIFKKYYHIENTWKTAAMFQIMKSIISLNILNARYPFRLLLYSIKSLFIRR